MLNTNDLIYELLCQLGLQLKDNYVVYQESGAPLAYYNKAVRFSYDGPVLLEANEVWMDIFNNVDMVEKMYTLYNIILFEGENIKTINPILTQNQNDHKYILTSSLIINQEKVDKFTNAYINPALCYLEAILDYNYNLSNFEN